MARKKKSRTSRAQPPEGRNDIAARLVAIRTLKGWSLKEAAETIGIPLLALRKLETGLSAELPELIKAADAYGTSLDYICGRSPSPIERFALARPELQRAQLNSLLTGLAQETLNIETLRLLDELGTMLAHELPNWPSLRTYGQSAQADRAARLTSLAQAIGRLAREPAALNVLAALVLRLGRGAQGEVPRATYSLEREEVALGHQLSAIAQMFGRASDARPALTPSRYRVPEGGRALARPRRRTARKKK